MNANTPTNPLIDKLRKLEARAQAIQRLRDINQQKWEKTMELARQTPEWKAYCASTGSVTRYNYGDVIC